MKRQYNQQVNTSERISSTSLNLHLLKPRGTEIAAVAFFNHLTPTINELHKGPEVREWGSCSTDSIKLSTSYNIKCE